jgi:hypothetical protein
MEKREREREREREKDRQRQTDRHREKEREIGREERYRMEFQPAHSFSSIRCSLMK